MGCLLELALDQVCQDPAEDDEHLLVPHLGHDPGAHAQDVVASPDPAGVVKGRVQGGFAASEFKKGFMSIDTKTFETKTVETKTIETKIIETKTNGFKKNEMPRLNLKRFHVN